MRLIKAAATWWGPPKKFDLPKEDRRVSWIELFYDLVYVIAISRITHHFSLHVSTGGFLEYGFLFILIFWGWLNGSLHHDLHGNEGLRTRLMTLWQMMIIAALAITIDQSGENRIHHMTIVFMLMQLFITYMWWSVGFYDRSHRRYNTPYTILFLLALALMGLSVFVPTSWLIVILPLILICNYAPPFVSNILLQRTRIEIDLSSSMFERLGLFAIIVFGELVLGVVNGFGHVQTMNFTAWLNFALAVSIVFVLWWIFFTLIANREVKGGFLNATLLEVLYIPGLISLGLMAVSFASFFDPHTTTLALQRGFSYAVATFLTCISLMLGLLELPGIFRKLQRPVRISLLVTALVFLISTFFNVHPDTHYYLLGVIFILVMEIIFLNSQYYGLNLKADD